MLPRLRRQVPVGHTYRVRIFLSAGEASGDAYGAALVRELRVRGAEGPFEGLGGPRMKEQGVGLVADSSLAGNALITRAPCKARRASRLCVSVMQQMQTLEMQTLDTTPKSALSSRLTGTHPTI